MGDLRKVTASQQRKLYNAIKGVNAKVTDLENDIGQGESKGFIPPFIKNNMERCASCNTDLTRKNIKDRVSLQSKEVNPNKFYFKELRDKANQYGIGFSQLLSMVQTDEQLNSISKSHSSKAPEIKIVRNSKTSQGRRNLSKKKGSVDRGEGEFVNLVTTRRLTTRS